MTLAAKPIISGFIVLTLTQCVPADQSDRIINRIHKKAVTIDSHSDTPLWFLNPDYSFGQSHNNNVKKPVPQPERDSAKTDVEKKIWRLLRA